MTDADRYRLAWTNARQRAAAYAEALEDTADERDALRAELVEQIRRYDELVAELRERVP